MPRSGSVPPLWNPDAAACWSLILSPAFGAFLHMQNWQALGEPSKAASARVWCGLSWVAIGAVLLLNVLLPNFVRQEVPVRGIPTAVLIAWYFASARRQVAYVKVRFGGTYPRRGWLKPLAVAVLILFSLSFLIGILNSASHGEVR